MADRAMPCRRRHVRVPTSEGGIPALLLRPARPRGPAVLWIHGGGYVTGMAGMVYFSRAMALVRRCGAVVLSPAYRLAGRAPYPAAAEDCYAALRCLRDHAAAWGARPDQLMVGGESAGGGLAAAVCMMARDRGEIAVAFQMPVYPMLDDRDTDSSRDNRAPVWNTRRNHRAWRRYLGPLWGGDVPPYAAPARQTDYAGLPPAYTFVGDADPFYCETRRYVAQLRAAGVPADVDVYPGCFHAFDMLLPWRSASRLAAARFEQRFRTAAETCFAPQPGDTGP